MTRQARNVGILFADISGSMRLYEAFGNGGALAAIEMCLGLVANAVALHNGHVIKTIGDEIMAAFPDVLETWAAALQIQEKIENLPSLPAADGPIKLGLRVGFSYGQAIENNGDLFGSTVNLAARMVQLARRGQILTTGDDLKLLPAAHRFTTRGLDVLPIKGKPDGVQVVDVLWKKEEGGSTTLISPQSFQPAQADRNELRLTLGLKVWTFDGSALRVTIGREQANDVVVPNSAASRSHATIERRRERWVLIDHSSNGSFVSSK